MKTAPFIIVQLIHIEGPLKGQIVELSDPEIKIGRHPSCQLKYPADLNIVSREHAVITREGNRFKLTDQSSNGTIVNGKRIQEIFLKDGDVITVSEGGPKVSFLTQITDSPPPAPAEHEHPAHTQGIVASPAVAEKPQTQSLQPEPVTSKPVAPPQTIKAPLIIQYGPTLQSFDVLPLKIGKHPSNGFLLDHANILDFHAEIYFADEQYYIKDLTGQQMITINGIPIGQGSVMQKDDELAFSLTGPYFRFLGNGRLGEEEKAQEVQKEDRPEAVNHTIGQPAAETFIKKPMSFLKKIISKR